MISNDGQSRDSNYSTIHEARRGISECNLCKKLSHVSSLDLAAKKSRGPKILCTIIAHMLGCLRGFGILLCSTLIRCQSRSSFYEDSAHWKDRAGIETKTK